MSIYSFLGKGLIALVTLGAGAAGTVLGASNSQNTKNYSPVLERSDINSNEQTHSDKDSKTMAKEDSSDDVREDEKRFKNEGSSNLSLSQDSQIQAEDEKTNVSRENLSQKDSPASKEKDEKEDLPSEKDQVAPESKTVVPPSSSKNERPSNVVNWFSVKLNEDDFFDEDEWPARECSQNIIGEQAVFQCYLNEDPSKPISFHLSLSSNSALKGKLWENLVDLHLQPRGDDKAILGLIFSDDRSQEIDLSLVRIEAKS